MTTTRHGLRVRKLAAVEGSDALYHRDHLSGEPSLKPFGGVVFVDDRGLRTDDVPTELRLPTGYVIREQWIELVNPTSVLRPAGPADEPMRTFHTFIHADEVVLHMLSGDHRYLVVGQPDKYDADGDPVGVDHDPDADVRWFYDLDLIGD